MRSRFTQVAVLLLLLSSLAVSDVRSGSANTARTPGGVFVRNLLLQASVEEAQTAASDRGTPSFNAVAAEANLPAQKPQFVDTAAQQTAYVHAVTGSSL